MTSIWDFIMAHQTIAALVGYYVVSAALSSLPMPDNTSGKFYRWLFQFSNTVAANLSRVSASLGTKGQQSPAPVIDPPSVPVAANPVLPPKP